MSQLQIAQDLIEKVLEVAAAQRVRVAVAVVDAAGNVVANARMDNVGYINLEVATRKARASANFAAPTHAVLEMVSQDATLVSAFRATSDEMIVLPGGFPLAGGGAFGIAGGHYKQDRAIGEQVLEVSSD
jgi:glc operon protein GlcG